jgi:hypothetical protein
MTPVGTWWSARVDELEYVDAKVCFLLPLGGSIVVGVIAFVFAPKIGDPDTAAQFSPLFSTAAQLIVTLLVALVLERRYLAEINAQRLVVGGSLFYIALGAAAAVIALNTRLGACAYHWLFALTLGAGAGALLSTLTVAYRAYVAEFEAEEGEATGPDAGC